MWSRLKNSVRRSNELAKDLVTNLKDPLWFGVWLLVLLTFAFPISFFCAGWYVVVLPVAAFVPALDVSVERSCVFVI